MIYWETYNGKPNWIYQIVVEHPPSMVVSIKLWYWFQVACLLAWQGVRCANGYLQKYRCLVNVIIGHHGAT